MWIRERIEQQETETLSPFASLACKSKGRRVFEEQDPVRTCFQRDRDRILHSKSFRRLKHKTQVFINPKGDHYRTRMTHTLEVTQIARTIARALRMNEDLTEAIALGHDVGHTPFGHAGEFAMDECLKKHDPNMEFRHYEQSLRVLTELENDGEGINLTWETLDGIGGHSKGKADLTGFENEKVSSIEAAIVRVSDRIAYLNHDLDDALRAGILEWETIPDNIKNLGDSQSKRIGVMVENIISESYEKPFIQFSDELLRVMNEMKDFLFDNVYYAYPQKFDDVKKAQHVVRSLFEYYMNHPNEMPRRFEGLQGVVDYVSGMTDRFAISKYMELFVPTEWTQDR